MTYCINPHCPHRANPPGLETCQSCQTPLAIHNRYHLLQPLRCLDSPRAIEIFEVSEGSAAKIMKVLRRNDPKLLGLFQQEAKLLQSLQIPGIPKAVKDDFFSVSLRDGRILYCLVLEKIEGQNLLQWLEGGGQLSPQMAIEWLKQILEILAEVHQKGFFHRDIKPSNLMLRPNGKLALVDFGAAREISFTYLAKLGSSQGIDSDLTQVISAGYSPPEQLAGRAVPQSDFYALGRTIVHLLTGIHPCDLPYDAKSGRLLWRDRVQSLPWSIADFIDDLMAPAPEERPQSATKILSYLTEQQLKRRHFYKCLRRGSLIIIGMGLAINYLLLPFVVEYFFKQGRKDLMQQDFYSAVQNYKKALLLDPHDLAIINNLALACKFRKDYACTLENYEKGLNLASGQTTDSETLAIFQYNRAVLLEDIQEFELALEAYQQVIESHGQIRLAAINNFARLKIWRDQDTTSTIPLIQQALEQTQDSQLQASLHRNLGWAYALEGNLFKAEYHLQVSIRLDPDRRAAPYCLLAKVQGFDRTPTLMETWQNCRDLNSENLPEVETWQNDAVQALNWVS